MHTTATIVSKYAFAVSLSLTMSGALLAATPPRPAGKAPPARHPMYLAMVKSLDDAKQGKLAGDQKKAGPGGDAQVREDHGSARSCGQEDDCPVSS
jgi:hypothetical protein